MRAIVCVCPNKLKSSAPRGSGPSVTMDSSSNSAQVCVRPNVVVSECMKRYNAKLILARAYENVELISGKTGVW